MAVPPVKSQPLHNFSLPQLQWAHRFRRTDPEAAIRPVVNDAPTQPQQEEEQKQDAEDQTNKPWKLRTRKEAAIKTTTCAKIETTANKSARPSDGDNKNRDCGIGKPQRKAPRKIWISLAKEEIEEDIYALTGGRPSRRPRKWPKNVQKKLDNLFPGLYLVGYTADSYRVANLWYAFFFIVTLFTSCTLGIVKL